MYIMPVHVDTTQLSVTLVAGESKSMFSLEKFLGRLVHLCFMYLPMLHCRHLLANRYTHSHGTYVTFPKSHRQMVMEYLYACYL